LDLANEFGMTGFCLPGKPGIISAEGMHWWIMNDNGTLVEWRTEMGCCKIAILSFYKPLHPILTPICWMYIYRLQIKWCFNKKIKIPQELLFLSWSFLYVCILLLQKFITRRRLLTPQQY
jgi:hypothetical protein